ncbi:cdp-diacylglycerol-glycerol-3-phosphate 3-phosphatidyltransferase [Moniliophthora roreri]|nr:cdp-diacylglycerol-glycerol-3-phosphate 3-phosphatidyltransferase [Moniliophthora roreri]
MATVGSAGGIFRLFWGKSVLIYPDRVHASFFRSPNPRGIMAKVVPPRFNEGWGTWHAKIYGADDDVMIRPHSFTGDGYTMFWPDFNTHPHHIHKKAEKAFTDFQHSYRQRSLPESSEGDEKVMVFPIIQAGQFNVREEEQAMDILFRRANGQSSGEKKSEERPLIDFTSGYFGLYKPYQDLVLRSRNVDVRIVAASPKANGFYGSKGISGRIPEGYTLLEQRFMKAVARAGRFWKESTGVQLLEWLKDGWTYHAKGLWLSPHASSHPVLTLFGSTNLNSRSSHIDTELSFVMILCDSWYGLAEYLSVAEPGNASTRWYSISNSPETTMANRMVTTNCFGTEDRYCEWTHSLPLRNSTRSMKSKLEKEGNSW